MISFLTFLPVICRICVPHPNQGSGQNQNESSNQSLCSVGSLSDKELEVGVSSTSAASLRVTPSCGCLIVAAFPTDS